MDLVPFNFILVQGMLAPLFFILLFSKFLVGVPFTCTGSCSIEIHCCDATVFHNNFSIVEVGLPHMQFCFAEIVGSCSCFDVADWFFCSAPGGLESAISSANYHS
eukprot:TRINITY_DN11643_c0_g1_i1.p1 TRINITY_DN11643_c0_g1~~TRINITY_DN11643_c0_g1_i1.p1  ORF type:complete len:105 (+),score=14.68 TRINITY_DN11643_c0_g1_i1:802-1116(+)